MTIRDRLIACKGVGPGFDHLRVGLSLSILFWHSFGISYGIEWTHALSPLPWNAILSALLPMFFSLSGFLIMGSAMRTNNLRTFITFRVLRILPALVTEISLSALIVGPLLTAIPLVAYFTNPEFFAYFGSLIGWVHYKLPGLFLANPIPTVVNGALWTVGPEILCYIIVSILMLTGVFRRKVPMVIWTALYIAICIATDYWQNPEIMGVFPRKILILGFLAGNLVFHYQDRLPYGPAAGVVAFVTAFGLAGVINAVPSLYLLIYPCVFAFAYLTALIGLTKLPPLPFFHRGDYSYGIYIYGFPIQQAITHFLPGHREWWINFAIALPLTLIFAVASWHLVEKPFLQLRKRFNTTRAPEMDAGPVARWNSRKSMLLAFLLLYGLFVGVASRIFPFKEIYHSVRGIEQQGGDSTQPPF
jgi:peptidoglycan/LPS O-acetylase OafA/YrhL